MHYNWIVEDKIPVNLIMALVCILINNEDMIFQNV